VIQEKSLSVIGEYHGSGVFLSSQDLEEVERIYDRGAIISRRSLIAA
jgi:ABC-type multidrug transport system ATPase subunit